MESEYERRIAQQGYDRKARKKDEKHIAYKDHRGLPREFPQIAKWALEGNETDIPVDKIPGLNAAAVTSGQFNVTRMPSQMVESFNKLVRKIEMLEQKVKMLERMAVK